MQKPENAIYIHVDNEDKTTTLIQGTGSNYKSKAVIINESGLYALILSSKLPQAKAFKRWVTSGGAMGSGTFAPRLSAAASSLQFCGRK